MLEQNQVNEILSLDALPIDVLFLIFKELNYKNLINVSKVNKFLNKVANDNLLWKMKLENDMNKWKIISSKNFPSEIFSENNRILNDEINYKKLYLNCCPDVIQELEILKKLKNYKLAADSSSNNEQKSALLLSDELFSGNYYPRQFEYPTCDGNNYLLLYVSIDL